MSLLIRAARHLGYSLPRFLREFLEIELRYTNFTTPFSIPHLSDYTRLTAADLVLSHTFFPYVSAFYPSPTTQIILDSLTEGASIIAAQFSFLGGSQRNRFLLRFCPDCAEEDMQQYGETYWHRRHLLPGVFICTSHNCALLTADMLAGYLEARNCDQLPSDICGRPTNLLTSRVLMNKIARLSLDMLNGYSVSTDVLLQRYEMLVDLLGGDPPDPRSVDHPIYLAMQSFYGASYLTATNFVWLRGLTIVKNRSRPKPTLSKSFGFTTHKHLLLNIYFDNLLQNGAVDSV